MHRAPNSGCKEQRCNPAGSLLMICSPSIEVLKFEFLNLNLNACFTQKELPGGLLCRGGVCRHRGYLLRSAQWVYYLGPNQNCRHSDPAVEADSPWERTLTKYEQRVRSPRRAWRHQRFWA